ncbi:MAG: hypothetical protein Q4D44_03895 [Eubacteriales bacterium]|nr:hypothetical protein [Eubacteriales bacterium]
MSDSKLRTQSMDFAVCTSIRVMLIASINTAKENQRLESSSEPGKHPMTDGSAHRKRN